MRVLVTGATGFVGSRLAQGLVSRGHEVRVLRRGSSSLAGLEGLPVNHVLGDILDEKSVAEAVSGCDLVFHVAGLATYWRAKADHIYRVNVDGTRAVMAGCLKAGVQRVVHTSTAAAIGLPGDQPANEATPFQKRQESFAYAHSKYLAEKEVQKAVTAGLSAVIVNPVVVIGPGDHNLVSGSLIVEMARRTLPAVPRGGISVADIDAVVQGHLAAAERGRDGERYILGGENLLYQQMAAAICEIVGRTVPRWTIPSWFLPPAAAALDLYNRASSKPALMSGDQVRLLSVKAFYDTTKAVRELDYPLMPFRAAAEKAYRWYLQHGYLH